MLEVQLYEKYVKSSSSVTKQEIESAHEYISKSIESLDKSYDLLYDAYMFIDEDNLWKVMYDLKGISNKLKQMIDY